MRIEPHSIRPLKELDHVESTLARLDLRDDRLGLPELRRQFDLGDAGRLTSTPQLQSELPVSFAVLGFGH